MAHSLDGLRVMLGGVEGVVWALKEARGVSWEV